MLISRCPKATQKGVKRMAMHDWNHNGKKDWQDNLIEHQIYKDVTGQKKEPSYTSSRGNGISTFGAIVSVIAGLFLQSALYVALGIDVDDVPILVIVVFGRYFHRLLRL